MARNQFIIESLSDFDITKNKGFLFTEINLSSMEYTNDNVSILIDKLTRLQKEGFVKFDTSYNIGYYDSVEDIGLTFSKKI